METNGVFATEIERCRNKIVVNSIKVKDVQSFVERKKLTQAGFWHVAYTLMTIVTQNICN